METELPRAHTLEFGRDPGGPPATPVSPQIGRKNPTRTSQERPETSPFEANSRRRAKSSLRLKYEAETQVIERKLGDLEAIRAKLGLSQRKIAQLLLVDPSAWTRWTKGEDQAPPHIYRMLQWYLALEEKYPALDVNFWLNTVAQPRETPVKMDPRLVHSVVEDQLRTKKLEVQASTELAMSQLRIDFAEREASLKKLVVLMAVIATIAGCVIGFASAFVVR